MNDQRAVDVSYLGSGINEHTSKSARKVLLPWDGTGLGLGRDLMSLRKVF